MSVRIQQLGITVFLLSAFLAGPLAALAAPAHRPLAAVGPTMMYWTDTTNDNIVTTDVGGTGSLTELFNTTDGLSDPSGIALDMANNKIYWTDDGSNKILRGSLDGSGSPTELVTTSLTNPSNIVLDLAGGKMYWSDYGDDQIERADLDGSNREELFSNTADSIGDPYGIALDIGAGTLYFVDGTSDRILVGNMDGSGTPTLVLDPTMGGPDAFRALAIDTLNDKLYWSEISSNRIRRADQNGSNIEELFTGSDGVGTTPGLALDIANQTLYFTNWSANKIFRGNMDGSGTPELLVDGGTDGISTVWGIALNIPLYIFQDGFESSDFTAWSGFNTGSGNMTVGAGCAINGAFGLCLPSSNDKRKQVFDTTPDDETFYYAEFQIDPNGVDISGDTDRIRISQGRNDATFPFIVLLRDVGTSYTVRLRIANDSGAYTDTDFYAITDAVHTIAVEWRADTFDGASDGYGTLYIDGVLMETQSGVDNDTLRVDKILLGITSRMDGMVFTGTMYMDDFYSDNNGYPE